MHQRSHYDNKSVRLLAADMIAFGSLYLITSRLIQKPLENLFGTLRGRSGCNQNPLAAMMRRNLQYVMVADLEKPALSTNCEDDDSMTLLSLFDRGVREELDELVNCKEVASNQIDENSPSHVQSFQQSEEAVTNNSVSVESDETINKSVLETFFGGESNSEEVDASLDSCTLEKCAKKYVGGCSLNKFNCSACRQLLTKGNQNYEQTDELLIVWKAYKCKENFQLGHLKAPSDHFISVTSTMYRAFTEYF